MKLTIEYSIEVQTACDITFIDFLKECDNSGLVKKIHMVYIYMKNWILYSTIGLVKDLQVG